MGQPEGKVTRVPMPSRLSEPHRAPRGGAVWPRTVEELARVLFAQGGFVWLSGRSLLFLVLLLGWLAARERPSVVVPESVGYGRTRLSNFPIDSIEIWCASPPRLDGPTGTA